MASRSLILLVKAIDQASATLRGIKGEVSGLGSEALQASRDLQPLGKGLTAVGTAGTALIVTSAMTAARVEVLGTVLGVVGDTAGYSEEQLNTFEAAVSGLGITTGGARQGLIQLMQAQIDLTEATGLAEIAQDAAVIANVNSSEAYETLIRSILTGRSVLAKSLGLTVDFNAAYGRMAEQLDKTTADLTAQEKMQARLNEVKRTGVLIEGTYEAAMGDVGKKLTSMPRLTEEAGRALGETYLPAMEDVVDATSDLLKAFIDLEPEQQEAIANFIALGTAVTLPTGAMILALPQILAIGKSLGVVGVFAKNTAFALELLGAGSNVAGLGLAGFAAQAIPWVGAAALLPFLLEVNEAFEEQNEEVLQTLQSYGYYVTVMERTGKSADILTEAEWRLSEGIEAAEVATSNLTDGWTGQYSPALIDARTLTDGWATSLHDAEGNLIDTKRATEDLQDATRDYSFEVGILTDAIAGPVKKAHEDYLEQQQKLNEKIAEGEAELADLGSRHGQVYGSQVDLTQAQVGAELAARKLAEAQAKLAENTDPEKQLSFETAVWRAENALIRQNEAVMGASGGITNYGEDIYGVEQDLAGWRGELVELEAQHEDSINRILFDIMLARLAVDGWTSDELRLVTETAKGMGIIDQETYDATIAMDQHLADFAAGAGVRDTRLAIMGTRDDLLGLGGAADTAGHTIPAGLQKAQHAFDDIDAWARDSAHWIGQIPRNIDITTNYHSTGVPPAGTPGGPEQYQSGTDYVPQTGLAYLHEGEAVLTKEENQQRPRGEGGSRISIVNHFGRDSVRSDEDMQFIIDSMQQTLELQGLRSRIA